MRHGIPTVYEGIQFRSILEARWAVFFDLIGWKWSYEPYECKGWIPDFLINGPAPFLVEVKPCHDEKSLLEECFEKSSKGCGMDFLLCGIDPAVVTLCQWMEPSDERDGFHMKDFPQSCRNMATWRSETTCEFEWEKYENCEHEYIVEIASKLGWGVYHEMGEWKLSPQGIKGKPAYGGTGLSSCTADDYPDHSWRIIKHLWREAGNRVQWKSPRKKGE